MARYWIVQPFRPGSKVQAEQRCADLDDVVRTVRSFRRTNADPCTNLRVYLPSGATDADRRKIVELGVEAI